MRVVGGRVELANADLQQLHTSATVADYFVNDAGTSSTKQKEW